MSVREQVIQKLAMLTDEEQQSVLKHIEMIEHCRGFDLRAWALQAFSEEEFLAGLEDIRKNGGHRFEDFFPQLERLVAEDEQGKQ